MTKSGKLRELMRQEKLLAFPGCYDCASAKAIEFMGFQGVYLTGYGTEASVIGKPDMGFMTMSELVTHAGNIVNSVSIPLVSDMDAGFGGMFNFQRTLHSMELAGVSGVHFEDQTQPKKCGAMPGKTVIPQAEMVEKIRLAIDTRQDPDFLLIARTDAKEQFGFTEVLRRLEAYLHAGADLIMVGERYTLKETEQICREFPGVLFYDAGFTEWEESNLSLKDYEAMGMKIVIYPLAGIYAAIRGVMEMYLPLKRDGHIPTEHLQKYGMYMQDVNGMLDIAKYRQMYEQFHLS